MLQWVAAICFRRIPMLLVSVLQVLQVLQGSVLLITLFIILFWVNTLQCILYSILIDTPKQIA